MSKCIDLTGANITLKDNRLTREKVENFVMNNQELFNVQRDDYCTTYSLFFKYVYFIGNEITNIFEKVGNSEELGFMYVEEYLCVNPTIEEPFWSSSSGLEYPVKLQNLQPADDSGILQNRAFIDFICDICTIEGGIWEAETPSAIITYNGSETTVLSGQTATLPCSNRVMKTDVVISIK